MLRRRFIQSLLALAGLASSWSTAGTPAAPRTILLQTSPIAGFQYHNGEAVWGRLSVGQALDLVREADNAHDEKAVRIEWEGHKLGYVPRIENHAVAQLLDRGEKLCARIVELKESGDPWERVRFAVVLTISITFLPPQGKVRMGVG